MSSDNIQVLVRSRLEQADDALNAAPILLEQHSVRAAVNRAYYAMFYAVLALLALRKQETSKHSGVISLFDREFVRPGVFSRDLSQWLHRAFRQRLAADCAPLRTVSDDEAQQMFDEAQAFVARVREHLARELHP
jgi:uncharacterized protein (UPF0332 family)